VTSEGAVLDTGSSEARGFSQRVPRALELMDCDLLSGCVRPRVMRL